MGTGLVTGRPLLCLSWTFAVSSESLGCGLQPERSLMARPMSLLISTVVLVPLWLAPSALARDRARASAGGGDLVAAHLREARGPAPRAPAGPGAAAGGALA